MKFASSHEARKYGYSILEDKEKIKHLEDTIFIYESIINKLFDSKRTFEEDLKLKRMSKQLPYLKEAWHIVKG